MLKKTLLVALAASAAAIAAAPAMAANNSPFTGFYVGAGATRDTADFSTKASIPGYSASNDASGTGFGGNLFAGYGYTFCNGFYLGSEVFGSMTSLEHKTTTSVSGFSNTAKIDVKNSYGLSVLPGYMITNNTLAYARVGYVRSKLEISNSGFPSDKFNLNGVQYGLGLQTALMNNLSLRGEYTYTNYQSESRSYTNNAGTGTARLNPSTDQFGVSLAYNFG